jgi:hypothetical protein
MDVDAAQQSQIHNIETTYGQPVSHWFRVIDASGLTKHNEVVGMLKSQHGLAHGAAHRLSLLARNRRDRCAKGDGPADPVADLYGGKKAQVKPLHDAVLAELRKLGEFDVVPKKGYLSLRRRKQFAMLQPSTTGRLDLALILPNDTKHTDRLEPATGFNALFTHRVKLTSEKDIDADLKRWLAAAYASAK